MTRITKNDCIKSLKDPQLNRLVRSWWDGNISELLAHNMKPMLIRLVVRARKEIAAKQLLSSHKTMSL